MGQCQDSVVLFKNTTKEFTVNECRKLCQDHFECTTFSVGISGLKTCIAYRDGCQLHQDHESKINTYHLSDCSGKTPNLTSKLEYFIFGFYFW